MAEFGDRRTVVNRHPDGGWFARLEWCASARDNRWRVEKFWNGDEASRRTMTRAGARRVARRFERRHAKELRARQAKAEVSYPSQGGAE